MHSEPRSPSIDGLLVHADFLAALARRLVSDEATANDVVQDAWLRALRSPPRAGSARGWFSRVVRNLVSDRVADERSRRAREEASGAGTSEERGLEQRPIDERIGALDELGRAFGALPEAYREALYLRYYEDLEPGEVALRLGVPLPTAKTRLRRGLGLLRDDLGRRMGPDGRFALLLIPIARRAEPGVPVATMPVAMKVASAVAVGLAGVGAWFVGSDGDAGTTGEADQAVVIRASISGTPSAPRGEVHAAGQLPAPGADGTKEPREDERRSLEQASTSGRLVYASTGEGVPYYDFELRREEGHPGPLSTDRDGRFTFDGPVATGASVELAFPGSSYREPVSSDGAEPAPGGEAGSAAASGPSGQIARMLPAGSSAAPEAPEAPGDVRELGAADLARPLPVGLGPTYFLDFEPPEGYAHDDFDATIVGHRYQSLHKRLNWKPVHAASPSPFGRDLPWVRLHEPRDEVYSEAWTWHMELLSRDGAWAGRAPVDWERGVADRSVRVELTRHTTLAGRVVDSSGRPQILRIGLQEPGGRRTHLRFTDRDGRYAFECLEPGEYTLFVRHAPMLPWSEPIVLTRGSHQRDVVLEARPPGGKLEGRVTSATGRFDGATFLYLEGRGDQDGWRRHDVRWREENGTLVGDFSFDVAHGTYRLVCNTVDGVRIAERARTVEPPQAHIEFLIEDDLPRFELLPRVSDGETGAALEEFVLLTKVEDGYLDQREMRAGEASPRSMHRGVEFRWWIVADGYRPAQGDQGDVGDGGVLEARLERGFGAAFHASDIASYVALEGVVVLADGVPVGETDASGDLVIDLPAPPERLGVDPARWSIYSDGGRRSSVDPETGAYAAREGVMLGAYLRRVE